MAPLHRKGKFLISICHVRPILSDCKFCKQLTWQPSFLHSWTLLYLCSNCYVHRWVYPFLNINSFYKYILSVYYVQNKTMPLDIIMWRWLWSVDDSNANIQKDYTIEGQFLSQLTWVTKGLILWQHDGTCKSQLIQSFLKPEKLLFLIKHSFIKTD